MRSARLAGYVWPGMILAGLALATAVWAAWPDPKARVVRLPYGEASPKTPLLAAPAEEKAVEAPLLEAAAPPPPLERPRGAPAAAEPDPGPEEAPEETGRVLAAVEPAPAPSRAAPAAPAPETDAKTTETVVESWGPDPIGSELDELPGYEPESPEELGAEPLPGFDVTPSPPAAG